jgi:DNA-binding response OmpR family regulator
MHDWKVLLIDDEKEFVSTLAERLSLRGIQVRVATDGEEGLKEIERDTPHVVVLDLMMPGLGGLEVLGRIKSDHPQIEVILLTGMGSSPEASRGILHGASDYLMKPLSIDTLIEKIGVLMKKQSGKAGDAKPVPET